VKSLIEGAVSPAAWRALALPAPTPEWFSGPTFVHAVNAADDPSEIEILAVFFDPGARTLPHVHATGQLLSFIEGVGVVGTEHDRRLYGVGGMAYIPAGEWHWHGATPDSPMGHLSIRPSGPTTWHPDVPIGDWESYMTDVRQG
jgi:quercetin dioxygenase-like cupin family protein